MKTVILLLFHIYQISTTDGAYPIERDLKEITGMSGQRTWMIFLERHTWVCLRPLTNGIFTNLVDVLPCLAGKFTSKWRCRYRFFGTCYIIKRGNQLKIRKGYSGRITFKVHMAFNINLTAINFRQNPRTEHDMDERHEESRKSTFSDTQYPWTFINDTNYVQWFVDSEQRILFEYSVSPRYPSTQGFYMARGVDISFPWNHFQVSLMRLQVNVITKLSIDIEPCQYCKLIVYDGPSQSFPPVLTISLGLQKPLRVYTSTSSAYLLSIYHWQRQDIRFRYAPEYIQPHQILLQGNTVFRFGNDTKCSSNTSYAKLCLFKLLSNDSRGIRFSLPELRFHGKIFGRLFAGLTIFDVTDGGLVKVCELNRNIYSESPRQLVITLTSTENAFLLAIHLYSQFVTIEFKLMLSLTECGTFTWGPQGYSNPIGISYISPSTFVIESSLVNRNNCFRIQVIQTPIHNHDIMFSDEIPAQVRYDRLCFNDVVGLYVYGYQYCNGSDRVTNTICQAMKCVGLWKGFNIIHDSHHAYSEIEIKPLPCEVPCSMMNTNKITFVAERCDICNNYYEFTYSHQVIYIKSSTDLKPGLVCGHCVALLNVQYRGSICSRLPIHEDFYFNIRDNMTIFLPQYNDKNRISVITRKDCCIEIPFRTIEDEIPPDSEMKLTCNRRQYTAARNGFWYRLMRTRKYISWKRAAKACHSLHGSLLTIYSRIEFDFVKDTFFPVRDTLVLYVGMAYEVNDVTFLCNIRISLMQYLLNQTVDISHVAFRNATFCRTNILQFDSMIPHVNKVYWCRWWLGIIWIS